MSSLLVLVPVALTIVLPAAVAVLATLLVLLLLPLLVLNPPLPHPAVVLFQPALVLGVLRRLLLLEQLPAPQELSPVLLLLAGVLLLLARVLPLETQVVLLTRVLTLRGVVGWGPASRRPVAVPGTSRQLHGSVLVPRHASPQRQGLPARRAARAVPVVMAPASSASRVGDASVGAGPAGCPADAGRLLVPAEASRAAVTSGAVVLRGLSEPDRSAVGGRSVDGAVRRAPRSPRLATTVTPRSRVLTTQPPAPLRLRCRWRMRSLPVTAAEGEALRVLGTPEPSPRLRLAAVGSRPVIVVLLGGSVALRAEEVIRLGRGRVLGWAVLLRSVRKRVRAGF